MREYLKKDKKAWVPRRRARAGQGAPPRARRPSPARRYQRFLQKSVFVLINFFRVLRLTKSGLVFRSRALRRNLTGEMRNSGTLKLSFGYKG